MDSLRKRGTEWFPGYLSKSITFSQGEWSTSCPQNGKLSFKADEQVSQLHEDVKRNRKYYHIIIFPEKTWNFTLRKKRTSKNHSNGPANKQHTNYLFQAINLENSIIKVMIFISCIFNYTNCTKILVPFTNMMQIITHA